MKFTYKSIGFAIAILMLESCESNLEKSYYSDSTAQPAILEAIQEEYVVDNLNPEATAITFKWTPAEVGYQASITNNIEMDIKGENNFGDKKVILYSNAGKSTEVSFNNKELNDQIYSLLKNYADEDGIITLGKTPIEFRITSAISSVKTALVSNVVGSSITPYDNASTGYYACVVDDPGVSELILEADKKDETALTLNWQPAYMGDDASITYNVYINLPENSDEYNIINKTSVSSVKKSNSLQLTNEELNSALVELLNKYNKTINENGTDVELYISSTKSNYIVEKISNKLNLKIKPYINKPILEISTSDNSYDFSWTSADGASYQLEMDINEDFAQRAVVASGLVSSICTISSDDLNEMIKYLSIARNIQPSVENLNGQMTIYFRVKAYFGGMETCLISENKTIEYDYTEVQENVLSYFFIGNYLQCEWNFNKAQKLYEQADGTYKAQIIAYDLTNGWKISSDAAWTNNWGATISEDGIMTKGGDDVTQYGGNNNTSYLVTFNPANGKLNMDNEEKTWRLIGDYNNYSSYGCDMIVKYDEAESEWYMVPEIGEEKLNYVSMEAGDEWLIRSQVRSLEVLPSDVEGHFEKSDDFSKFKVSESGNYEIRWYFNKPEQYIIVIKK